MHVKMNKNNHPAFPETFNGFNIVWGQGNSLISLNLLASIPTYTLYEEGTDDYNRCYKLYWDNKKAEYEKEKGIYDECVFVGTTFKGSTDVSVRITKIVINELDNIAYVCFKASHEQQVKMDQMNANKAEHSPKFHFKPGRYSLTNFLSLIQNKQITIIKSGKDAL